jgi:hypothetical protein
MTKNALFMDARQEYTESNILGKLLAYVTQQLCGVDQACRFAAAFATGDNAEAITHSIGILAIKLEECRVLIAQMRQGCGASCSSLGTEL